MSMFSSDEQETVRSMEEYDLQNEVWRLQDEVNMLKVQIATLNVENELLNERANLWTHAKRVFYANSTGPGAGYYFTSDPVDRFRTIPTLAEFVQHHD